MAIAVVLFPGSNCDQDTVWALGRILGAEVVEVPHTSADVMGADAVVLPGGFSYGDYLRSGALAARSPVMGAVRAFAQRGGPVLGVCNGFQVLTEAGLLPGALARNDGLHFVCKDVHVRVERAAPPFTGRAARGDVLRLPVAHHDGRFVAGPELLARLEGEGRIAFRYVASDGRRDPAANPNGSDGDVAGIVDARGTVLGMMPHPERAADPLLGGEDGLVVLGSLLDALAGAAAEATA
ncbi:MAG: phosphoribosylformylglycinamidine synthase subunit PurQ [Trueperaceae bacterium]|nr:phosphoribosylformylglycinamidine synthase subunit PurQ [Trueperaceae bacterium]